MILASEVGGGMLPTCRSCAAPMTEEAWQTLPLARTITSAAILRHVSVWPAHAYIAVRRCSACGREIARTVRDRSSA